MNKHIGEIFFEPTEQYEVWAIHFVGRNNALSKKYFYKVDINKTIKQITDEGYNALFIRNTFLEGKEFCTSSKFLTAFNIKNEDGYDYRESNVVLSDVLSLSEYKKRCDEDKLLSYVLREIVEISNIHSISKSDKEEYIKLIKGMKENALKAYKALFHKGCAENINIISTPMAREKYLDIQNTVEVNSEGITFKNDNTGEKVMSFGVDGTAADRNNDTINLQEICIPKDEASKWLTSSWCGVSSAAEDMGTAFKTLSNIIQDMEATLANNLNNIQIRPDNDSSDVTFFHKEYEEKFENFEKINYNNNTIKNKGENTMFENVFKNIRFGKVSDVKMSIYGPAFMCGDRTWYAYDEQEMEYVDVTDLCLDVNSFCYAMPVAAAEVQEGDFIIHNNAWARVNGFDASGYVILEKIYSREIVTVMPTRSAFGFDFYTKLWCPFASLSCTASADAPFGNMLPFILMGDKNADKNMLLPFMMMQNGGIDFSNPMMLMLLMGDKGNNDMLLPLAMMQNGDLNKRHKCNCHHCNESDESDK